ncbi:hypothetical protein PGT21_022511 [Puccinia graminis f. sp. tritici]|uniref:Uncharacterized protein n=1 Tax=Puccinia graminis f. sp. tritici TaxID=56615 RepID=A0A5B0MI73_PUCGR|nr:hypothetical protein PGT21_022511 [Puccinia graminis f. sp. tritici]
MNKKISTPSNRPVAPVHPPFVRGTQAPLNYTADSRFSAIFDCAEFTGYSPDPGGRSPPKLHNFNFDFPSLSLSSTPLVRQVQCSIRSPFCINFTHNRTTRYRR